ncbi:unnamed protein product [Ilex paraguariensis]|uniref:Multiprotein bridging factor 1 N-terminal domain-containing protein n=1 Tax=Ilex paraguariensis TaxID=185542 RepID=A0ABC8QUZ7_9AQUA
MSGSITQDWEPVVIRKKAPTTAARKDEKAVNAARRSGAEIETAKSQMQAQTRLPLAALRRTPGSLMRTMRILLMKRYQPN